MGSDMSAAAGLVGEITGDHRLILNPAAPLESARELVRRNYLHGSLRTLHHQGGSLLEWRGTHYAEADEHQIRAVICGLLDAACRIVGDRTVPFDPTPRNLGDVLTMLRVEVQLPSGIQAPAWLDGRLYPSAREIFACSNGLLYLPAGVLHPHTPVFWGCDAVDYAFNPHAREPKEWLAFLESVWPGDAEAIRTLQEIFGYMLTEDTGQQKAFLIVGPPRSGKGTIARILTRLLGPENVAGPTFAGLSGNFGLAPLIGKPLAIISDARLGGKTDQSVVVERLLSITGEDTLTIDRKYREPWTGRLPTRFLILTNELPRLTDASGAVASRFILLRLQQDFRGREDHGLTARLLLELPAILNWAVVGRARLAARGHFVQTASGQQSIDALKDLTSPIGAFLRDCAVVDASRSVECEGLFHAWVVWCQLQGRNHPGNVQTFGRDLHAALPTVTITRPREGGARTRRYEGVGLAAEAGGREDAVGAWAAPRGGED
jgi:putative DNA primase/helicase